MKNDLEVLDILSIISFTISLLNYKENLKQTSNNELFKELQNQDATMSDKIIKVLHKIELQNQEIINLLKKGDYYG